jgi:hypothetical protein
MSNIIRLLAGMIGVIVCFVSLINVWMTWMKTQDTSFHWTIAFIGAVMWLQALPIVQASDEDEYRQRIRKHLRGE